MDIVAKNIRHLRRLKQWSQEQLAEELGITRARVGSYEENRCDPPLDILLRISSRFHVAVDALLRCDLSTVDYDALMKVGQNRILFPIVTDRNNNDLVEVVTVKASAGYLTGYGDPEYVSNLPVMNLPFRVVGKHRAFPVRGDSMPPLKEGSFVIGKFVESLHDIRDGHTYIIVTRDDGIAYKRLFRNGKLFMLYSDNKLYDPYPVKPSDIIEVWQFVCALNTSDKKEEELNLESIMDMLRSMRVEMQTRKI